MSSPNGTLPNINIIPAIKSKVASKFLILKALYDAEATKKANKVNIVADNGVKIVKNIQEKKRTFNIYMSSPRMFFNCISNQ